MLSAAKSHYTLAGDAHLEQQLDVRGSGPSLARAARLVMYLARASLALHDDGRPCVGAALSFVFGVARDD